MKKFLFLLIIPIVLLSACAHTHNFNYKGVCKSCSENVCVSATRIGNAHRVSSHDVTKNTKYFYKFTVAQGPYITINVYSSTSGNLISNAKLYSSQGTSMEVSVLDNYNAICAFKNISAGTTYYLEVSYSVNANVYINIGES